MENTTTIERLKNVVSYTELQAIKYITGEIGEKTEATIVASKAAITGDFAKSVAISAMKLLVAAGVIETNSLGAKGTHIKIINRPVLDELVGL